MFVDPGQGRVDAAPSPGSRSAGSDAPPSPSGRRSRCDHKLVGAADLDRAAKTAPSGGTAGRCGVPLRIWALHLAYAERQEPEVLAALVEQYASRAVSCARRFERQGEPIEDLVQVAYEALVKALKRFDPELGLPFAALATPTIEGALKRHFRDRGYLLHAPRKVHESLALVRWGSEHLHNELQREPTDQEVAAFVHLSVADVRRVGEAERARRLASLDSAPLDPPERRRSSDAFDRAEDHDTVLRLLRPLEPHEREVVYLYYFEGLSQAAIASRFDVSQMQVSRWLAATLARIRSNAA